MKFKNPYNSSEFPAPGEKFTRPSLTVPDQTMSIQEIMRRFAQGLSVDGERVPIYNGEEDLPDINRMDLVDRQEFAENLKESIEINKKKLSDLEAEGKKKEQEDKKKTAKQLSIEEDEQEPPPPPTNKQRQKKQAPEAEQG